jgi:3-deoxy-D-manno-octulosonic acid kinase
VGLRYPVAAGPVAQRGAIEGGAMLYEARWHGNLPATWFDAQAWRDQGGVVGAATGRGQTLFVMHQGVELALRHYRRGGLAERVFDDRYWYTGAERTRPFREWSMTHWLLQHGLPVPEPVAACYRRSGQWYRGELLTRRVMGAVPLAALLAEKALSLATWVAVGRCVRRFHDMLLCHADLNAHNILLRDEREVTLIDFDRSYLARRRGLWCDNNLVRLRRSLLKITDVLPPGRFAETDWQSLLAGYRSAGET